MSEWTPKEHLTEEVIFRATIAKQFDVFWTEVDSNPLKQLTNDSALVKKVRRIIFCTIDIISS